MRAYYSMPVSDFIGRLRDAAIANKASPLVIDLIDSLDNGPTVDELQGEREKLQADLEEAQSARDDLAEELGSLCNFIEDMPAFDPAENAAAVKLARLAINRNTKES